MNVSNFTNSKPLISIITPVLNEEENILNFYSRMSKVTAELEEQYDFEFVFTDNHSDDKTFEILTDLASQDKRIRAFRFSKNFGYQNSIFTGYTQARGNAAIEYDCDLQDPPELLTDFLQKWKEGYKIVYGVRATRKEGVILTTLRKIFYRLINVVSDVDLPHDAGDFMLLDRLIIDQLIQIEDRDLYIRGLAFSFGYDKTGIIYHRESRAFGETKFSPSKLLQLALNGIVNMSVLPLRVASYFGIFVAFFTLILSIIYGFLRFFNMYEWPAGFTTNVVLILFSISLNALFLGIIGEYLGKLVRQNKKRPISIIESRIDNMHT